MFGIVVVSHSRKLSENISLLACEVSPKEIPISFAGGAEGRYDISGTDATDIVSAIEKVYTEEGVIVFTDIGSSILSAELAKELIDPDRADRIFISSAPLVEGTISAAVLCSAGAGVVEALGEAEEALKSKRLKTLVSRGKAETETETEAETETASSDNGGFVQKRLRIKNLQGLHARPAARFIQAAAESGCIVKVYNEAAGKGPVNGLSLNRLQSLEILYNHEIVVQAKGVNAFSFLQKLEQLAEISFGEAAVTGKIAQSRKSRTLPAAGSRFSFSRGIGIGEIVFLAEEILPDIQAEYVKDTEAEKNRLLKAICMAENNIKIHSYADSGKNYMGNLEIFEAYLVILKDPDLLNNSLQLIDEKNCTAEAAWVISAKVILSRFDEIKDAYLKSRAADIKDVSLQVLKCLGYRSANICNIKLNPGSSFIAIASDITPAEVIQLYDIGLAGLVLEEGSADSHAAIIARTLNIPGIGGYKNIKALPAGDMCIIDGFSAEVFINPSSEISARLSEKAENHRVKIRQLADNAQKPAVTAAGRVIPVYANVSSEAEAAAAKINGADGIGVIRTEYLYINSPIPVSEELQYDFFTSIFRVMKDKPVTVRTFDIGGDKQVPFMDLKEEKNPYLGIRGIRLYPLYPDIFKTHIRAVLRSGYRHRISIMLPMVVKTDEIIEAKKMIKDVHLELEKSGIMHKWPVPIGIMIETPASVFNADSLAEESDFFSIGTNDLTQYVMAAERGNRNLTAYNNPFDPAVLKALELTVKAAGKKGIPVSLCGEMGSEPEAVDILLKTGIASISANPQKIPEIKQCIRSSKIQ